MESKGRILAHIKGIVEWRSGKDGEPVLAWVDNQRYGDGVALVQDEDFGTWLEVSHSFQQTYATIIVRAYPALAGYTPVVPPRIGPGGHAYARWVSAGKAHEAQLRAAHGWASGHAAFHHMDYGDQEDVKAMFLVVRQLCNAARVRLAEQYADEQARCGHCGHVPAGGLHECTPDQRHDGHVSCTPEGCVVR